jgi:sugar phosphate isomerase/epimerase
MSVREQAELARRLGACYLELVVERLWGLPGPRSEWGKLRGLLEEMGLEPLVHAPYIELNPASLNPDLRQATVRCCLESLELAAFLEAGHLVFHVGYLPQIYPEAAVEETKEALAESLRAVLDRAEELGVTVVVENGWNGPNHPIITSAKEHAALVEAMASPALGALFDIGHAHTFGTELSEDMGLLKAHLRALHLHDNHGVEDEHLALGQGTVPLAVVREAFQMGLPVILELNTAIDMEASLAYLEKNLGL